MDLQLTERVKGIAASQTLAISAKASKLKADGADVVNFGVGEPDFSTPDFIVDAAIEALKNGKTKYTPVSGILSLRQAVVDELEKSIGLKYSPDQVVVGNGAKQPIYNVVSVLIEKGDEVIIPSPYWVTYPEIVKYCGGKNVFVQTKKENGFKMTPRELESALTPATKLIILNTPSNPTGAVYTKDELKKLADVLKTRDNVYVLSDEIYKNLVYDGEKFNSIAAEDGMKDRTIIVDGVSKSFAMTGWRLGWCVAPAEIAKAITRAQSHMTSCPNSIAQYAALSALTDEENNSKFISEMRKTFENRRNAAKEILDNNHIEYVSPKGAFYIFVKISDAFGKTSKSGVSIDSSIAFCDALLSELGVAAVPGDAFGAKDYVRISYALDVERVKKGVSLIAEFVRDLK